MTYATGQPLTKRPRRPYGGSRRRRTGRLYARPRLCLGCYFRPTRHSREALLTPSGRPISRSPGSSTVTDKLVRHARPLPSAKLSLWPALPKMTHPSPCRMDVRAICQRRIYPTTPTSRCHAAHVRYSGLADGGRFPSPGCYGCCLTPKRTPVTACPTLSAVTWFPSLASTA